MYFLHVHLRRKTGVLVHRGASKTLKKAVFDAICHFEFFLLKIMVSRDGF